MIKKYSLFLLFIIIFTGSRFFSKDLNQSKYAAAKMPTPVFNTWNLNSIFGGKDGNTLKFGSFGEIEELEFIALTGSVFTIEDEIKHGKNIIYKVTTNEYKYPSKTGYYIDSRFVIIINYKPEERRKILPSKKIILKILRKSEGAIYTWGGNYCPGIPELFEYYPPSKKISNDLKKQWILSGVDCSGILYEAVNGCIPRNTSSLVNYGSSVKIENLTASEIAKELQPLDIIVWKGHMMVVLDNGEIIESSPSHGGVKIFPAKLRLKMLLNERKPVDEYNDNSYKKQFVVRRWMK